MLNMKMTFTIVYLCILSLQKILSLIMVSHIAVAIFSRIFVYHVCRPTFIAQPWAHIGTKEQQPDHRIKVDSTCSVLPLPVRLTPHCLFWFSPLLPLTTKTSSNAKRMKSMQIHKTTFLNRNQDNQTDGHCVWVGLTGTAPFLKSRKMSRQEKAIKTEMCCWQLLSYFTLSSSSQCVRLLFPFSFVLEPEATLLYQAQRWEAT